VTALADAPPWALALLREARVGRLATVDGRGRPLVVPVCFALADDVVYSAIDAKPKRDPSRPLRRVRNIAENPHVALVIDDYDEDWSRLRYVIVEGTATILTGGEEFSRAIDRLRDKYPQYRAMGLGREGGTLIRMQAVRVLPWRFA
jgi:PPOX class probable F420-dependent enzyme